MFPPSDRAQFYATHWQRQTNSPQQTTDSRVLHTASSLSFESFQLFDWRPAFPDEPTEERLCAVSVEDELLALRIERLTPHRTAVPNGCGDCSKSDVPRPEYGIVSCEYRSFCRQTLWNSKSTAIVLDIYIRFDYARDIGLKIAVAPVFQHALESSAIIFDIAMRDIEADLLIPHTLHNLSAYEKLLGRWAEGDKRDSNKSAFELGK